MTKTNASARVSAGTHMPTPDLTSETHAINRWLNPKAISGLLSAITVATNAHSDGAYVTIDVGTAQSLHAALSCYNAILRAKPMPTMVFHVRANTRRIGALGTFVWRHKIVMASSRDEAIASAMALFGREYETLACDAARLHIALPAPVPTPALAP